MKQGKIMAAYDMLKKKYRIEGVPFGVSDILFRTKKKLEPYIEHESEQEMMLVERLSSGMNPDGSYQMTEEQKTEFMQELNRIQNTDVDFDLQPATIQLTDDLVIILGFCGEVMDVLDGIIHFEMKPEGGDPQ